MDSRNMPIQMLLMKSAHLLKYQTVSLLERFDMNLGQAAILFILKRYGNLTQRQLSGRVGITPPSMNVALRKMEEKGLVKKEADPDDQRKTRIHLTDMGKSRIEDLKQLFRKTEEITLQDFREEERLLLRRFLVQIEENIMDSKELKDMDLSEIMRRLHPEKNF
ncbi:MarR family transcriptional regulator [Faecalicatena contorta]|uniref:MarR family transcriptional regulator n=1 Tax=Faecalicatena fissicatena TaxID=290055 RepID=A0ABS2E6X4_9FIRM|nr:MULTISPECIES: MarR family transcriptional regulator [Clostridia]MBM6686519.1 MarR family transcriptional regulator [Faecalicatena contorta]MBM6711869.1 MarR family transcriptional regulator [Faecalicatena contorta]MBM6737374.1 MarR family transcriptional regulator [Faecalicatena fissicatena]